MLFPSSKLQSELRTTNLEELKITVETYYEEVTSVLLDTKSLLACCLIQIFQSRTSEITTKDERERESKNLRLIILVS